MNKRPLVCVVLGLLAVGSVLLASCAPVPDAVGEGAAEPVVEATEESWENWETIKIGVPTLITGPGAPMGADIMAGIGMAVEEVNAEGGVLGKPLEIVYGDIKGSGAEDCSLAAELMNRAGVVANFPGAFFGPACVHEFGRYEQPTFHATASKEAVDPVEQNFDEYRNMFQVSASEESFGVNAYQVMTSLPHTYPNEKVALLGGDISYDMLIQEGIAEMAEADGWEIVLNDHYPYGNTEFGAQLAKIRAEEPAIIFGCITSVDSAVAFINQFLENPTNSLIFIQWAPVASEFLQLMGEKANGVIWQTEYAYLPTADNITWAEEFEAQYGRAPGAAWPALMDDMLHIWIEAVQSAGDPTDYQAIYQYIEDLDDHPYAGRAGTYGMDPARHEGLTGAEWLPIHVYQVQNGENTLIYLGTEPFSGTDAVEAGEFVVPPWFQ
jgi:branched-chain amino acid transport system substrate-binding protein